MTQFYFNDCLPEQTKFNIPQLFHDAIKGFSKLSGNLTIIQSLVLSKPADQVIVCGVSLKALTDTSPLSGDKDIQQYAKRLITQYSLIRDDINTFKGDEAYDYLRKCTFQGRPANDLMAAGLLGYWAFTLPIEDSLKKDILTVDITDEDTEDHRQLSIENYYVGNAEYVENSLNQPQVPEHNSLKELENFFLSHGKKCEFSSEFAQQWEDEIAPDFKEKVNARFEVAYNAGLLFPPQEDRRKKIVHKDELGTGMYELKQKGSGLRVYFNGDADKIYICLYGTKTSNQGADQKSDFRTAAAIYNRMINMQM